MKLRSFPFRFQMFIITTVNFRLITENYFGERSFSKSIIELKKYTFVDKKKVFSALNKLNVYLTESTC